MKQLLILFILFSSVLLMACDNIDVSKVSDKDMQRIANTAIVCNAPYIRFETGCCLDANNNLICDEDEQISSRETIVALDTLQITDNFDKVIVNSKDWKDVYSSAIYAGLLNKSPCLFFVNAQNTTNILYSILKYEDVLIISSDSNPYVKNYKQVVDSYGLDNQEVSITDANLDLANELIVNHHVEKFILVDDTYGYDALSVAPYAILDNYYVIFVNSQNIDQVDALLKNMVTKKILLYGNVASSVKSVIDKYNPEIINNGDRYSDNLEIVSRFKKINNTAQALVSDGSFIEASIISGDYPLILIDDQSTPTNTINYLKNSGFESLVLINNNLIDEALKIKRATGISIFVKFAQGSRTPTVNKEPYKELDRFPVPAES